MKRILLIIPLPLFSWTLIEHLKEGTKSQAMIERRNCPRVKVCHRVLYFADIYPRPMVASTFDLGLGGARIETTPYTLTQDEKLEVLIAIHPRTIKCRGKVVHLLQESGEKPQAGIRFEEISEQDRLYLQEYISSVMERRG